MFDMCCIGFFGVFLIFLNLIILIFHCVDCWSW